jgi:hypothetical protein
MARFGSGGSARRKVAEQLGSIVAITDSTGAMLSINAYDKFGKPGANQGRF